MRITPAQTRINTVLTAMKERRAWQFNPIAGEPYYREAPLPSDGEWVSFSRVGNIGWKTLEYLLNTRMIEQRGNKRAQSLKHDWYRFTDDLSWLNFEDFGDLYIG